LPDGTGLTRTHDFPSAAHDYGGATPGTVDIDTPVKVFGTPQADGTVRSCASLLHRHPADGLNA
jgi:hypothetical protein